MARLLAVVLAGLSLAGSVSAQQAERAALTESTSKAQSGIGIKPASNPFGLLDLSRINWSHSYSVAFFSGGGRSASVGVWNTTLDYDISTKLHLAINLGVLHSPGALLGQTDSQASFLPGFRLDFRPSDSFLMSISVQQVSGHYLPYSGWRGHRGYGPLTTD